MANLTQEEIQNTKEAVRKEIEKVMTELTKKLIPSPFSLLGNIIKWDPLPPSPMLILKGSKEKLAKIEAKDKLQKLYDKLKVNEEYFKDELLMISTTIKGI